MKANHIPCCLHLHHCAYTQFISELPAFPGPSSTAAPSCCSHTVGTGSRYSLHHHACWGRKKSPLPSWCHCQLLSVSFSLSLYCSNETAQLLPAWQQWFPVHTEHRDRAWGMSLIPPSLHLSTPVWTWAHFCLRSSSAGLMGRALVPGSGGCCSANNCRGVCDNSEHFWHSGQRTGCREQPETFHLPV